MTIDQYDDLEAERYYARLDKDQEDRCPICDGAGRIYYHYHLNSYVPCTRREYEKAIERDPNHGGYWEECDNCDGTGYV